MLKYFEKLDTTKSSSASAPRREEAPYRGNRFIKNEGMQVVYQRMPDTRFDERGFQDWYGRWADTTGIDPSPDTPEHKYDYRAAMAGAEPTWDEPTGQYHWPSRFKADDHPNRYVNNIDTKTGEDLQLEWDQAGIDEAKAQSGGTFLGGVGVFLSQVPSMVTNALPETVGRSLRQGRKSLEESWLDRWIEENRLEGKKAKILTDDERESCFTMPFTGQKVTYKDAVGRAAEYRLQHSEHDLDRGRCRYWPFGRTDGGGPTGGASLPLAGAAAGGLVGGMGTSAGATKDQFIDIFHDAFKKDFPKVHPSRP